MVDQIDIIIADLDLFTRDEIVMLATNMDANLRESPPLGTPVYIGWARANWVPSVGEPWVGDADKKEPTTADVEARAQVAAQGFNDVLDWKPNDGPIFVTNNVPYIGALNRGHSKQSPRGFVQIALEKAVRDTYSVGASKAGRLRRSADFRSNTGRKPGTVASHAFERARDRRPK